MGLTVSASTLGVALAAPIFGALTERLTRKRVILVSMVALAVPTMLAATSPGLKTSSLAVSAGAGAAGDIRDRDHLYGRGVAARVDCAGDEPVRELDGDGRISGALPDRRGGGRS